MPTLFSKTFIQLIKLINFNPELNDDIIGSTKKIQKLGLFAKPVGFSITKYDVDGLYMESFSRNGVYPKKCVYLIHGGAFIAGLSNLYREPYLRYHKASHGGAVFNIDYRVAPENTYPAAHDDVLKGWTYITENLGYSPKDIVVVGDSAGGNLTLSLLLKLRDENKELPKAAVVMSPWCDLSGSTESYRYNYKKDPMFGNAKGEVTPENIEKLLQCEVYSYAGDTDRKNPYLSPYYGDYSGMPPIHISVGSHELLYDEVMTVAKKIEDAGGKVQLHVGEGMFHVFPLFWKILPEAKKAFDEINSFISEHTETYQVTCQ